MEKGVKATEKSIAAFALSLPGENVHLIAVTYLGFVMGFFGGRPRVAWSPSRASSACCRMQAVHPGDTPGIDGPVDARTIPAWRLRLLKPMDVHLLVSCCQDLLTPSAAPSVLIVWRRQSATTLHENPLGQKGYSQNHPLFFGCVVLLMAHGTAIVTSRISPSFCQGHAHIAAKIFCLREVEAFVPRIDQAGFLSVSRYVPGQHGHCQARAKPIPPSWGCLWSALMETV